jgi:hypothetical protein
MLVRSSVFLLLFWLTIAASAACRGWRTEPVGKSLRKSPAGLRKTPHAADKRPRNSVHLPHSSHVSQIYRDSSLHHRLDVQEAHWQNLMAVLIAKSPDITLTWPPSRVKGKEGECVPACAPKKRSDILTLPRPECQALVNYYGLTPTGTKVGHMRQSLAHSLGLSL